MSERELTDEELRDVFTVRPGEGWVDHAKRYLAAFGYTVEEDDDGSA